MVAVTTPVGAVPAPPVTTTETPRDRSLGLVPTASMITGAAIGVLWFWIPFTLMVDAVSSIPSVIGFLFASVVFIYLMRGVDWVERMRSEAVFGLGIPVPYRKLSHYSGFQR